MLIHRVKTFFPIFIALFILVLVGCKQNPAEEYGDALLDSMDRGRATVNLANMKSLQDAVRMFYSENGRYPASLEEASVLMGSQVDLQLYNYDPVTGQVTMKKSAMID
jgi:hypothetical protein